MAKRISRKELKHDEFVDAAFDFGRWLEENWARVAGMAVLAVIVVVAVLLWQAWSKQQAEQAMELLAQGIDRYEQAQVGGFSDPAGLSAALETFAEVAEAGAGGTDQLARYYQGATLFHLGRLDEAREELQQVVSQTGAADTMGAAAHVLLARVEVAAGRTDEAVALLEGLVDVPSAGLPPAQALLELGRLHKQAGREEQAQEQWQRIVDEYPQSIAAAEARSLLR
jgi:predicted negative regulator of RcsB-dependent stress response